MSLFDGVNKSANVEEEKDRVKGSGGGALPSNIYNLVVKYAYGHVAKSGAKAINLVLEVFDNEGKSTERTFRQQEYFMSGDKKGNKTFYTKDGKDYNLPGFTLLNDLCMVATGKGLFEQTVEMKTIPVYDFEKKEEVSTEVEMLTSLCGKPVAGCVLEQIQDKTQKNDQGDYIPTGETRTINIADKFLDAQERKTAVERKNGIAADFKDQWLKKWEGQVDDQSTKVEGAGTPGAPAAPGAAAPAAKAPLFGGA